MCVQLGTKFGIHLTLEQWYRQYGPIYKFFLGKTPVVVVTGILNSLQLCATLESMIVPMLLQMPTYRRKEPLGCMHGNACKCVTAPLLSTQYSHESVLSLFAFDFSCPFVMLCKVWFNKWIPERRPRPTQAAVYQIFHEVPRQARLTDALS